MQKDVTATAKYDSIPEPVVHILIFTTTFLIGFASYFVLM